MVKRLKAANILRMARNCSSPWANAPANFGADTIATSQCMLISGSVTWFPTVFTFSFTNKELQTDPLTPLRERFEQADIKLLTEYNIELTSHVVSRKRNTAKGLQALINSKYVVTETFLDAITEAMDIQDELEPSLLEQDFDRHWPDAMLHLPPKGGEPVQHPDSIYAPDPQRKDVFEGYTFIFYDETQYGNLMAPITNGGGKAMLRNVVPDETQIDDFVRYVKEVAGEKGLGSFEDGSEGKGVVLVRYIPAKGDHIEWCKEFITAVSLRLDHRPIEQNEFLEAILINDASKLRRPLEVESLPSQSSQLPSTSEPQGSTPDSAQTPSKRHRFRGPIKRRFAGFDDDADISMNDIPPGEPSANTHDEEGGLFVSQDASQSLSQANEDNLSQRKRAAPEDDLMDGIAPAAAKFKRQRIEQGGAFASPSPEPKPVATQPPAKAKKEKMNVLAMAARHREEEEARAKAEREDLANLPEDIDLAEIRRLNIVEELELRGARDDDGGTREEEVADGRWNPKWNGVKNFKKFRRRGEVVGREPTRTIINLTEVKTKGFGIGDNYWLEEDSSTRYKNPRSAEQTQVSESAPVPSRTSSRKDESHVIVSESDEEESRPAPVGTSSTKITSTPSQLNSTAASTRQTRASQAKRPPQEPAASNPSAKRSRPNTRAVEVANSDESEDELKFRFGRRR